ncbi:MAG: nuclear transport factor 2 family protein [Chloroflexi bacterium]|nr:MAG: nuclear transport factor 2 family protein [Chloroflexota bacterium]MBL1193353.1 nuclear transport factor 2 family protein [Chloroflexota bacterium]NOH10644.1 nuclear transport factor 2 family protein [Chloroflexota bacterium]
MTPGEFLIAYEAALATQDWGQVAPLVHEDATVTFSNGVVYKGINAVQGAFEKNFSSIKSEEYSIAGIHWVRETAKYAVCNYTYHWQGIINGELAGGAGRGTSVLVNENRRWLLLAEHLTRQA